MSRIADARVEVEFDDQTSTFQVRQKSTGRTWQQAPAGDRFTVDHVTRKEDTLEIQLRGTPDLTVRLHLAANSDLEMEISAAPDAPLRTLSFPGPLKTPGDDWNLVFPLSEGVLLPAGEALSALRGRNYAIYNMSGLIMPWAGVTDPTLGSGYMLIVDTPFDAEVRLADIGAAPSPVWKAELGKFGYTRRLRYHFFDAGGYVAQAKHYREYVRRTGEFTTLRERAKSRPQIDRLVGAVHIYTWADGRTADLARELKAAGIERAWVGWDPSHPPYPEKGYDEALKSLGYLAGVYDLYRDCYDDREWDKKTETNEVLKSMWLHRYPYPGLFEKIVARTADQSPMQIRFSNDVGLMRYWTCTKAQLPYVPQRITRELQTYPHDSVFVDVTLAAGLFECQSTEHPMTCREDAAARLEIHKYMAEKLHMVVGSEWGADFGAAHTEFMHGLVTLAQFWGDGTRDKQSPYYDGDWNNTAQPTMVLGEPKSTERYWKYGLGPQYRIPLFELVYHDCVVASWRWDDNSHKRPDAWARKDLFSALYGVAPQWNLDRAMWQKNHDRFVASFKALGPLLRTVGYEEMLDHRSLTPDRSVQQTVFSSGKKVIVNFGDKPYAVGQATVPAGEFRLLQE